MRKTLVPQLGQTPETAGFPFLSVTGVGFLISTFILHLTQYACGISVHLSVAGNVVVYSTHAGILNSASRVSANTGDLGPEGPFASENQRL